MTLSLRWFLRLSYLLCTVGLMAPSAGAVCPAGYSLSTPDSDFTSAGNGMVQHTPTGLIWKRCAEGQSWDGSTCTGTATTYTWQAAFQRVDEVNAAAAGTENLGQTDWRMPNVNELKSLVEEGCYGPAINLTQFPNTPASFFWSASPFTKDSGHAWSMGFNYGYDGWDYRSNALLVRLVRAGQSFLGFDGGASGAVGTISVSSASPTIGDGLVASSDGKIKCTIKAGVASGACNAADYPVNTQITLTATPDVGFRFLAANWTGCDSVQTVNGQPVCAVTISPSSKPITVNFENVPDCANINPPVQVSIRPDTSNVWWWFAQISNMASVTNHVLIGVDLSKNANLVFSEIKVTPTWPTGLVKKNCGAEGGRYVCHYDFTPSAGSFGTYELAPMVFNAGNGCAIPTINGVNGQDLQLKINNIMSDSDNDGLPDEWESRQKIGEFDYSQDADSIWSYSSSLTGAYFLERIGTFNVPGGRADYKDIYVWVDELITKNQRQLFSISDYLKIIDAYNKHGINIHFRVNKIPSELAGAWGLSKDGIIYASQVEKEGLAAYKNMPRGFNESGSLPGIRNHVYHYVLAGQFFYKDGTQIVRAGGEGIADKNAIYIGLNNSSPPAGVLFHALGHILGLGHGGPWFAKKNGQMDVASGIVDGSNDNYKPNRFGIMNYMYGGPEHSRETSGSSLIDFDYASFHVATIDENQPPSTIGDVIYDPTLSSELRALIASELAKSKVKPVTVPCGYQNYGGFKWFSENISSYNPSKIYVEAVIPPMAIGQATTFIYCSNHSNMGVKRNINADTSGTASNLSEVKPIYSKLTSGTDWDHLVYNLAGEIGNSYGNLVPGNDRPDYSNFYRTYKDVPHPSLEILYVQPSYGLSLNASDVMVRLVPSASVIHTFTLINQGKLPDTYDLSVTSTNGILTTLQSSNSVTLAPGAMIVVKVQTNTASLAPTTQGLVMLKAVGRRMQSTAGADMVVEIVANASDATPIDNSLLSAVTQPGTFSFTAQTDVAPGTTASSNPITVSQITVPVPISIDVGEYQIDSGPWTRLPGFVAPGQRVTVRLNTPQVGNVKVTSTLNINGVTSSFSVTTSATSGTTWTGTTPNGGNATLTLSGPGVGTSCKLASANFITAPTPGQPANVQFPYGLIDFRLTGCAGSTVSVTMSYPAVLPAGTQYWKQNGATYTAYPATISGNQITFSVTDNGAGDSDPAAGAIHDPSGPGIPNGAGGVADIPTLSEWVMLILLSILLGVGGWQLRRKSA